MTALNEKRAVIGRTYSSKMAMIRCALLDDYQNVALGMADWTSLSGTVDVIPFHRRFETDDDLVDAVRDCQIVVAMRERTPFRQELLARLPNLKLLVTTGPKNASIDVAAARTLGIVVCGTRSTQEPPAELTWALILGLARSITAENAALRTNGPWQNSIGIDLKGSRLGILGLGRIGSHVARVALAFGMNVVAWSQNLTKELTDAVGVDLAASKEELLETADFVSVHLLLSKRTRGLIGKAELKRMQPTAYLINTSRAAIVDQDALVEALENHWIAGAGLDVFEVEPLPPGHPLRVLPNVLATPHLGYVSKANYRVFYGEALEDIKAFLAGEPIRVID